MSLHRLPPRVCPAYFQGLSLDMSFPMIQGKILGSVRHLSRLQKRNRPLFQADNQDNGEECQRDYVGRFHGPILLQFELADDDSDGGGAHSQEKCRLGSGRRPLAALTSRCSHLYGLAGLFLSSRVWTAKRLFIRFR